MDQAVMAWREGRAGRIRLNRPKALNALDLSMVTLLQEALERFRDDPAVQLVLIDGGASGGGGGARGFCAGGDIRAVREHALAGDTAWVEAFFTAEYQLNQAIAEFPKPYVALIDGVCMGGGIGVSVHGSHRVASEAALFAMPETMIALVPDIGASYLLPRLPGRLGLYLGLTGARLAGADAVHAGLATHFVPSERLPDLAAAVLADGVAPIGGFAAPLPAFSLAPHRAVIDRVFAAPSLAAIIAGLDAEPGDFAARTLASLRAASPMALHWSFALINAGAGRSLGECLAEELRLVTRITRLPEFHEGVRAALVDKDRQPRWRPARIEEVDPAAIAELLA